MKHQAFRNPAFALLLADGKKAPIEVQLLKCGTFSSPQYGTFEITPTVLLAMKKNFDDKVRKIDLAIDYAHESDKVAAGWIDELMLQENDTQLWARVRWTDRGSSVVLGLEYKYLSADFTFEYQDNETLQKFGPTLLGAGLTNRPVLKGMAPVELSEGENKMDEKDKMIAALQEQLKALQAKGVASEATLADLQKKCGEYEAGAKAASDKAAGDKLAADATAKLAEKKGAFDLMLSEGKVVEAQREPFMKDNVVDFAKLAKPLNLSERGSGGGAGVGASEQSSGGMELLKLAESRAKEKNIEFSEAVKQIRTEKPDLWKKYQAERKGA